jgi:hypothetical protein
METMSNSAKGCPSPFRRMPGKSWWCLSSEFPTMSELYGQCTLALSAQMICKATRVGVLLATRRALDQLVKIRILLRQLSFLLEVGVYTVWGVAGS